MSDAGRAARAACAAILSCLSLLGACTFVQDLQVAGQEPAVDVDAANDASDGGDGASAQERHTCVGGVTGVAQNTSLDFELVIAWERLDGAFVVVRGQAAFTGSGREFTAFTSDAPPPQDAWIDAPGSPFAVGHVYALRSGNNLAGTVRGLEFLSALRAGTYRYAVIWSPEARGGADGSVWHERVPRGLSAWRCDDGAPKNAAYREARCDELVLESAGDPVGGRHCDWH